MTESTLKELIKNNKEDWIANIAIAFYDEYLNFKAKNNKQYIKKHDLRTISNNAAKNFLNLLLLD